MSTNSSVKWIDLETCPVLKDESNEVIFPAGINKDNFIALEYDDDEDRINCIHKYNIETNKWTTMDISIWNDIILSDRSCYPVLDTKQMVIYFLYDNCLMQMELNSKKIIRHLLPYENNHNSSSQCIFLNNELFVIGGDKSH
eukprot:213514_1